MAKKNYIFIETLCLHYQVDEPFFEALQHAGLVEILDQEGAKYVQQEKLSELEKMIRLHQELNLNIEGIDVVMNLLDRIKLLQKEMNTLKNKLHFGEIGE
ncbi:MAG: chaperone modulator CbpM [Saprospiraceae bacterium]